MVGDLFMVAFEFQLLVVAFEALLSDGHDEVEGLADFPHTPPVPGATLDLFPQPPLEISGLSSTTITSLSVIIFSVTDIPVLLVLCVDLDADDSFDVSLHPSRPVELVWLVVLFWWSVSGITSLPSLIMFIYCVTGNS